MVETYYYTNGQNVIVGDTMLSILAENYDVYGSGGRFDRYGAPRRQTRSGIDSNVIFGHQPPFITTSSRPSGVLSSSPNEALERHMFFLGQLAEKHGWDDMEFNWQRPSDYEGPESFTPQSGTPFGLTGHSINDFSFYDQFTPIYEDIYCRLGSLTPYLANPSGEPQVEPFMGPSGVPSTREYYAFSATHDGEDVYTSKPTQSAYKILIPRFTTGNLIADYTATYYKTGFGSASFSTAILGPKVTRIRYSTIGVYPYAHWTIEDLEYPETEPVNARGIHRDAYADAVAYLLNTDWIRGDVGNGACWGHAYTKDTYQGERVRKRNSLTMLPPVIFNGYQTGTFGNPVFPSWSFDVRYNEDVGFGFVDGFPIIGYLDSYATYTITQARRIFAIHVKKQGARSNFGIENINDMIVNALYASNRQFYTINGNDVIYPEDGDRIYNTFAQQSAMYSLEENIDGLDIEAGVQLGVRNSHEILEQYEFDNDELIDAESQGGISDVPDMLMQEHDVDFRVWIRITTRVPSYANITHSATSISGNIFYGMDAYNTFDLNDPENGKINPFPDAVEDVYPEGGNYNSLAGSIRTYLEWPATTETFTVSREIQDYEEPSGDRLYFLGNPNQLSSAYDIYLFGERVGQAPNISFGIS